MVSLDVKKLLREERQRRLAHKAPAPSLTSGEHEVSRLQSPLDLGDFAVGSDRLQGLYYIPDALTRAEEQEILDGIDTAPASRWVQAEGRRVLNYGGKPGCAAVTEALPPFLATLVHRLEAAGVLSADERPNHCLVNSYERGGPCPVHGDGPLYLNKVVTCTLGGSALIGFRRSLPDGTPDVAVAAEVLLRPRCAFVVSGEAYSRHQHGIEAAENDKITTHCCNAEAAGVAVGEKVPRAHRRVSLVFVRKMAARQAD